MICVCGHRKSFHKHLRNKAESCQVIDCVCRVYVRSNNNLQGEFKKETVSKYGNKIGRPRGSREDVAWEKELKEEEERLNENKDFEPKGVVEQLEQAVEQTQIDLGVAQVLKLPTAKSLKSGVYDQTPTVLAPDPQITINKFNEKYGNVKNMVEKLQESGKLKQVRF